MDQLKANKEFVLEYFNAISGVIKTKALLDRYITDPDLTSHILFFDSVLPRYELFVDEMTAEGNRVIVLARLKGSHEGEFKGIPPTGKKVEFSFAIGYEIEDRKIQHHWLIADQMSFMEQLGLAEVSNA